MRIKNLYNKNINLALWQQILIAMVLGIILGIVLGTKTSFLEPIGNLFLHAIQMMIVPIISVSIITAFLKFDKNSYLFSMTVKAFIFYIISMIIAAIFAITIGQVFHIGVSSHISSHLINHSSLNPDDYVMPGIGTIISNIIPSHPIMAMAKGQILQVLVFSIIFGIAFNITAKKSPVLVDFFKQMHQVVFNMVNIIMKFAPLGIFALISTAVGENGIGTIWPLFKFVLILYITCISYILIYYGGTLKLLFKVSLIQFFKDISSAISLAFSSSSSAATLPETIRCAEEKLNIDKAATSFLLPLGTSFNLNGLAIYLTLAAVFTANLYHIHLSTAQYIYLIFSVVFTCTGAGGLPGTAMLVMGAVVSSIGLPIQAISLIFAVDRLNDMMQTTTNVIGDIFVCYIVDKNEKN